MGLVCDVGWDERHVPGCVGEGLASGLAYLSAEAAYRRIQFIYRELRFPWINPCPNSSFTSFPLLWLASNFDAVICGGLDGLGMVD